MKEDLNFQNFQLTDRKHQIIDYYAYLEMNRYSILNQSKKSKNMALLFGDIKGQQIVVKKVFFVQIFDQKDDDDSIIYNRELTENTIEYVKKIFNLQIVGFFVESQFTDLISSMYLMISQYKQNQFILVCGQLLKENMLLDLSIYVPNINKNFNTCFGSFIQVPYKIENSMSKYMQIAHLYSNQIKNKKSLENKLNEYKDLANNNKEALQQDDNIRQLFSYIANNKQRYQNIAKNNNDYEQQMEKQKQQSQNLKELIDAFKLDVEKVKQIQLI